MTSILALWNNVTQLIHHHPLLALGLLLIGGFFLGKLCELVKLPSITGYILSGLVLGASVTGVVNDELGHGFSHVTEIALSMIALTIGGEFSFVKIKRTGVKILIIT